MGALARLFLWIVGGACVLIVGGFGLALFFPVDPGTSGITPANFRAVARADHAPAPTFQMPGLDPGSRIDLGRYRGKVAVVNFWASWCAPCRKEAPGLARMARRHRPMGVAFIGINYRDSTAAANAFVDEFDLDYPHVFDEAGELAADYELQGIPTTYVIAADGDLLYELTGFVTEEVLIGAIQDAQNHTSST
ncbi:MAG: TlpA disulfide reductase family protein [Planctomycetales bacterium]